MHHASLSMHHVQATIGLMNELGRLILQSRLSAGLSTQKDLAEKIGKDPSWVSRLERGLLKEMPGPGDVQKISEVLGLSQTQILSAAGYSVGSDTAGESPAEARLRPLLQRIGDNEALLNYVEESIRRDIRFYSSIQRGERDPAV